MIYSIYEESYIHKHITYDLNLGNLELIFLLVKISVIFKMPSIKKPGFFAN